MGGIVYQEALIIAPVVTGVPFLALDTRHTSLLPRFAITCDCPSTIFMAVSSRL